ncbi:MAG: transcription termination/antitermination factor NusG [Clostridia bacterium]|nr:transcription termination/antitermination factor NusG [Clostridia bacterium]MBQ3590842.1 transcription termination/antitermination factor NusG [Clostridia bacterium]
MNVGLRWYVAHTYSGYENKVKTNLEKIVENRSMQEMITDIRIPTETVVESDGGREKEVESKIFPSYVLIKMVMTDETWHIVRNIRGVTGFVGPGSKPVPLTDEEVAAIITDEPVVTVATTLEIGDMVEIIDGLFRGQSGRLAEISEDGENVTVLIPTVGRDMPLELERKFIKKAAEL